MKRSLLFFIVISSILLIANSSAFAETFTGCLKGNGKIIRVNVGTAPKKPCKQKWVEITWNEDIPPIGADPIEVNDIQDLTVDAEDGTFILSLGLEVSDPLPFDISAGDLQAELQDLAAIVFPLLTSDPDVKVTQVDGVYRISFVGELSDKTRDETTLTVDDSGLFPSPGSSATVAFAKEREIGLAPGFDDGDLLVWDEPGNNWVAMPPRFIPSETDVQSNMQPWLGMNYVIATVGLFPSRNAADPLLGEIMLFGGNFAPRGWALCDGQLLPISSNSALFSILGTTYGGDGRTTFGLPDLRGRVAVHPGTATGGVTRRSLGEKSGNETHDHQLQ